MTHSLVRERTWHAQVSLESRSSEIRRQSFLKTFHVVLDGVGELQYLILAVLNGLEFSITKTCFQVVVNLQRKASGSFACNLVGGIVLAFWISSMDVYVNSPIVLWVEVR